MFSTTEMTLTWQIALQLNSIENGVTCGIVILYSLL
jgi:hypothetical protein